VLAVGPPTRFGALIIVVPKGLVGLSRPRRGARTRPAFSAAAQRHFSKYLVRYGTMALRHRGPGAATRGVVAKMPREDRPGWVRRPCLRWRRRAWVVTAASAEMPCMSAGDRLAVVRAPGKYAVQAGLIGYWAITSFEKIARGSSYRAQDVALFSGCLDVQRQRSAWNLTLPGPSRSRACGNQLHPGAGVLAQGRSGGCRGDARQSPAGHRGLHGRADASGIGRGARGGRVR
jgi:hypothetical protein